MRLLIILFFLNFLSPFCLKAQKIETTATGYKYIHHIKKGKKTIQIGEYANFHAYFRNGEKLITSTRERGGVSQYKIPETLKVGESENPVVAGLRLMSVGDSLTVFMSIDTVKNLPEELKGVKELEYDLVLTEIMTEAQYEKDKKTKEKELAKNVEKGKKRAESVGKDTKKIIEDFKSNKLGSKLVKTPSGLQYLITKSGKGAKVENGSIVSVQYLGALMNGESFDDSFSRGMEAFSFKIGDGMVITGWEEGLTYFREGDKGYIFIPSKLGYGEQGAGEAISPNSDLVFYIEMEKVTKE